MSDPTAVPRRRWRRAARIAAVVLVVGVVALAGSAWLYDRHLARSSRPQGPLLGPLTAAALAGAGPVRSYRLPPKSWEYLLEPEQRDEDVPPVVAVETIRRYPAVARGKDLSPEAQAELIEFLTDPASFTRVHKRCIFEPGVVFSIGDGANRVDVLVCFHCNQLQVFGRDDDPSVFLFDRPRDFVGGRPLLRIAREAFPDDPALEALLK